MLGPGMDYYIAVLIEKLTFIRRSRALTTSDPQILMSCRTDIRPGAQAHQTSAYHRLWRGRTEARTYDGSAPRLAERRTTARSPVVRELTPTGA